MTRNELIISICREAGDVGDDASLISGYERNYDDDYLRSVVDAAATGDAGALAKMRSDAGLAILS